MSQIISEWLHVESMSIDEIVRAVAGIVDLMELYVTSGDHHTEVEAPTQSDHLDSAIQLAAGLVDRFGRDQLDAAVVGRILSETGINELEGQLAEDLFDLEFTLRCFLSAGNSTSDGTAFDPGIVSIYHDYLQTLIRRLRIWDLANGIMVEFELPDEVAHDNPQSGTAAKEGRRRRRQSHFLDGDRRIVEAWRTGRYRTYAELAKELGCSVDHVKRAIDRDRHRPK